MAEEREELRVLTAEPGTPVTYDYEYARNDVSNLLIVIRTALGRPGGALEVTKRRTKVDSGRSRSNGWWTWTTRTSVSCWSWITCARMLRLRFTKHSSWPRRGASAERLEIHYTTKHGRWTPLFIAILTNHFPYEVFDFGSYVSTCV